VNNFIFTDQIDLQLALVFIGVIIIISIIIYNLVRAKKSKLKQALQATIQSGSNPENTTKDSAQTLSFGQDHQTNEILGTQRKEPSLGILAEVTAPVPIGSELNSNIGLNSNASPFEIFKTNNYVSRIDPNIDCVVAFRFSLPISGAEIIECVQKLYQKDHLRIVFEGLRDVPSVTESVQSSWELLQFNNVYREIQAGLQLANRRGPIGSEQLSEFLGLVQNLSQELYSEIDIPPLKDILNDAKDLDQFAIQCDIQLGFNLTSNMLSWQCSEIQSKLLSHGFNLSREGSSFNYMVDDFLLFKAQVSTLNFLRDDLQTTRIDQIYFSFDVPLIPIELNPFIKMLEIGRLLAKELDGRLLDDNGQVLSILLTQNIQNQLKPIYQLMKDRQIEPGSPSALRLFN
jgi:hypothetical protein